MTRKQQLDQCKELLKDIKPRLIDECKRLISTGGINYTDENKNEYGNAKAIIKTALENKAGDFLLFSSKYKEAYNNLKHF